MLSHLNGASPALLERPALEQPRTIARNIRLDNYQRIEQTAIEEPRVSRTPGQKLASADWKSREEQGRSTVTVFPFPLGVSLDVKRFQIGLAENGAGNDGDGNWEIVDNDW